jgi:glutaredoxin
VTYTSFGCVPCSLAKQWMTVYGIPFEERDIDASLEYAQELRQLIPGRSMSTPTFEIDGDVVVGFDRRRLLVMLRRAALRRSM